MSLISTVGSLQQDVARKLGTVSSNTGFADKVLEWINAGIEDLSDVWPDAPWKQSSAVLSLSQSSPRYKVSSIDANLSEIKSVRISALNTAPRYLAPDLFNAQHPKPDTDGTPTVFTLWGDDIVFDVRPPGSYGAQIDYLKDATVVSAASAVPPVPRRWLPYLSMYCQMQGLYDREDYSEGSIIEAKYEAAKKKMRMRLQRRVRQQKRIVSVREIQANNRGFSDEISNMFFNE